MSKHPNFCKMLCFFNVVDVQLHTGLGANGNQVTFFAT